MFKVDLPKNNYDCHFHIYVTKKLKIFIYFVGAMNLFFLRLRDSETMIALSAEKGLNCNFLFLFFINEINNTLNIILKI